MSTVNELLESVQVVSEQKHENLTLRFYRTPYAERTDIISFDDAVKGNFVTVAEIGEGDVNEVQFCNLGNSHRIFVEQGYVIGGLKQSRALQSSILIGRQATIRVPVVCVERQRWGNPYAFKSSGMRSYSSLIKELKLMKAKGGLQGRVWDSIERKLLLAKIDSKTRFLGDFYKAVNVRTEEYKKSFNCPDSVNGLLAVINEGKPVTVEMNIMPNHEIFKQQFPAMLSGLVAEAMDAEELRTKKRLAPEQFMRSLIEARKENRPTYAEGEEIGFETDELVGSVLCADNSIIFAGAYPK